MPPPLTHDRCREEMCAGCGGKAGRRKVTAGLGEKIRKWAQPSWSAEVVSHPSGICETCRRALAECEKLQSTKISRGVVEKWGEFKLEKIKILRGQLAESCVCVICKARKENNVGTRNNKSELNKKQIKVEEKEVKGDEEKESEKKILP